MRFLLFLLAATILLSGCAAPAPLGTLRYQRSPGNGNLVILLPGIWSNAGDFAAKGFLATARQADFSADFIAADATVGYYLNSSITKRLKEDIVDPARRSGYKKIWLAGISLGGLGALLYQREHPNDVDGIFLISPYLGRSCILHQIAVAGGLREWTPEIGTCMNWERDLWSWLKNSPPNIPILLGYGAEDPYVQADIFLAGQLPASHVIVVSGGHNWKTWNAIWERMLAEQRVTREFAASGQHERTSDLVEIRR